MKSPLSTLKDFFYRIFRPTSNTPEVGEGEDCDQLLTEAEEHFEVGRQQEAVTAARKALSVAERHTDPNHSDIADCLHDLGSYLSELGRRNEAEPLFQQVLAINEKNLGPSILMWHQSWPGWEC